MKNIYTKNSHIQSHHSKEGSEFFKIIIHKNQGNGLYKIQTKSNKKK